MKPHPRLLATAAVLALAGSAAADPRPAVLELFTSEGCSSCPPAEAIVGELAQRRGVLPLSFHVDYWDDLGWRDRFSLASATQRQRIYARVLHHSSVYTPQAVIDGQLDVVGSQRGAVTAAVAQPRDGVATTISVREDDIDVAVGAQRKGAAAQVLLVGFVREATSKIGRGENSGRTLKESNIVRTLQLLGDWNGNAQRYHGTRHDLPAEVTDVAVLVQTRGQGLIFGAATQPLR